MICMLIGRLRDSSFQNALERRTSHLSPACRCLHCQVKQQAAEERLRSLLLRCLSHIGSRRCISIRSQDGSVGAEAREERGNATKQARPGDRAKRKARCGVANDRLELPGNISLLITHSTCQTFSSSSETRLGEDENAQYRDSTEIRGFRR